MSKCLKGDVYCLLLVWFVVLASACSKLANREDEHAPGQAPADKLRGDHSEHGHPNEELHPEHRPEGHDHEGHGHGEHSDSNLDLSVEVLFEKSCEHQVKTFQCDECRYEVGVVKVPARLLKDGLVTTIRAEKKAVSIPLRLTGEIQFDDRRVTHISTQVSGVIRRVHVTLGETVKAGQPLLEIESVEVGKAKAVYQEALAMKKLAEQNFERIDKLQKEGISSEKESLLAKQELDAASIRATSARGVLSRIGMSGSRRGGVNSASSSGTLLLRAGSTGTVLEMHAVSGEVATSDRSLVTIGENSTLWVWADLYEKNYAVVSEAQAKGALDAEIQVKAFPGRKFPGVVDFISPAMSETSRTIKVRIAVPNPEGKLLAGMFADVDVFIPGDEQALSLPSDAVLVDDDRSFVFVHHREDYYVQRPVARGRDFGHWVEIKEGLVGTESVIAKGAFLLKSDVLRSKMGAGCAH